MNHHEGKVEFIGVVEKTRNSKSIIRIYPEFCEGLKGIDQCESIIVLYWFHLRDDERNRKTLRVIPKRRIVREETGVFACRSPSRPNPIGLCIVKLLNTEECVLTVKGLDALVGSPVIDIKPNYPENTAASKNGFNLI